MRYVSVAIDGPAGAGKTTMAREVSAALGLVYVDTGAMYRAIALYAARNGVQPTDCTGVTALLPGISLDITTDSQGQRILLGGEDVTALIRGQQVSIGASDVSAHVPVRNFLLDYQRGFARRSSVVMEGRDIGTVVLPNADVKIYLTATSRVRAERRKRELAAKGEAVSFADVHRALLQRDKNDMSRAAAPLKPAADSVIIDTTHQNIEMVKAELIQIIKEKTGAV